MAKSRYYRRKKYYHTPSRKTTESSGFNVYDYLRDEFYCLEGNSLEDAFSLYRSLYGISAYRYLRSVYSSWRLGYVEPSPQSLQRIIECVPPFLSFEKRFLILNNEIESYAKKVFTDKHIKNIVDLIDFYKVSVNKINDFGLADLYWFIGKGIIDTESAEAVISTCKYVLINKLNLKVEILNITLPEITNELALVHANILEANYRINYLNININLKNNFQTAIINYYQSPSLGCINHNALVLHIKNNFVALIKEEKAEIGYYAVAQRQIMSSRILINAIEKNGFEADVLQSVDTSLGAISVKYKVESIYKLLSQTLGQTARLLALTVLPCVTWLAIIKLTHEQVINKSAWPLLFLILLLIFISGASKFTSTLKAIIYYGQQRKRSFTYRQQQTT